MTAEGAKKFVIKYLPLIVIYVAMISYGFYGTAVRQKKVYDKFHGMHGTVTSFSLSRSGDYICSIRLENGMYGTVNNGCNIVNVGDPWINHVTNYNPLIGMSGTAYFIVPHETRSLLESIIMVLLFVLPLIGIIILRIILFIYSWIKNH